MARLKIDFIIINIQIITVMSINLKNIILIKKSDKIIPTPIPTPIPISIPKLKVIPKTRIKPKIVLKKSDKTSDIIQDVDIKPMVEIKKKKVVMLKSKPNLINLNNIILIKKSVKKVDFEESLTKTKIIGNLKLETFYDGMSIYLINRENGFVFPNFDVDIDINRKIKCIGKINKNNIIEWY